MAERRDHVAGVPRIAAARIGRESPGFPHEQQPGRQVPALVRVDHQRYVVAQVLANGADTLEVDAGLVVPDPDLSIADGALAPWSSADSRPASTCCRGPWNRSIGGKTGWSPRKSFCW